MSKKIIAVAAAAALAFTGLVAPANAAQASLTLLPTATVNGTVTGDGLLSTTAWVTPVPSQDLLRLTTTASRSVLSLEIKTRSDNASVTVTSTGAVKLITAAQLAASTSTTATGTQSISLTSNDSGVATFYAYSTSVAAASITATESGTTPASNTGWLIGSTTAGNAYKLAAVSPTIGGIGSLVDYTATVVDMFGNAIIDATVASATLGGDATGADSPMVYDAVTKVYEGDFTNRTTAGQVALLVSIAVSADSVTAFGAKNTSVFVNISGADLQAAVTALQAQVAALQAQLAVSRLIENSVTQKKYNTLARKWNAAFPSKAVALKK
jgi:hypothetical protein